MLTPTTALEIADKFLDACDENRFVVSVRGTVVTISKTFDPGDSREFVRLDSSYYSVLSLVPASGGSIWGTDGGSVGGQAALDSGRFVMNISGVKKRFIDALGEILRFSRR